MITNESTVEERLKKGIRAALHSPSMTSVMGRIRSLRGSLVSATLPTAPLGALALIERQGSPVRCLITGVDGNEAILSPLDDPVGITVGSAVRLSSAPLRISPRCDGPLKMMDSLGEVLGAYRKGNEGSRGEPVHFSPRWRLPIDHDAVVVQDAPPSLRESLSEERPLPRRRFETGIRSIDALCPLAEGQRVAIIAPPGCGKSTLLLQLASQARYDVLVMALVGERRREIRECEERLRYMLAQDRRAIVIAEPSDASPTRRLLASQVAVATAEEFAARGCRVLLMIDSLTRVARAIREVGLMRGEKIVRGGYTASVYSELPRLLERAGPHRGGVITSFHSLLSHDERDVDPLKEEVISLLDGHLVLSESLTRRGVYPAIHPTRSLSRLAGEIESDEERRQRLAFLAGWERLERDRDAVLLGGKPDAELKRLIAAESLMNSFISQPRDTERGGPCGGQVVALAEGQRALAQVLSAMRGDTPFAAKRPRPSSGISIDREAQR